MSFLSLHFEQDVALARVIVFQEHLTFGCLQSTDKVEDFVVFLELV